MTGLTLYRKALITTSEVLTELLKCTERLLKPWVPSLLRVCLPKARSPLIYVARRMMQCIGLLAQIAGEEIIGSLDEIMELLITTLQDPTASPITKDIVLVSIGQVCGNTANVVDPYVKYPELFTIFRRFLKGEAQLSTKRKVMQVMGILGAIDPYTRLVSCVLLAAVQSSNTPIENAGGGDARLKASQGTTAIDQNSWSAARCLLSIRGHPIPSRHIGRRLFGISSYRCHRGASRHL